MEELKILRRMWFDRVGYSLILAKKTLLHTTWLTMPAEEKARAQRDHMQQDQPGKPGKLKPGFQGLN
jgi:hypothetical protein